MAVLGLLFLCLSMTVADVVSQGLDDRHALEEGNTITGSNEPYKFEVIANTEKYSKTFLKGNARDLPVPGKPVPISAKIYIDNILEVSEAKQMVSKLMMKTIGKSKLVYL